MAEQRSIMTVKELAELAKVSGQYIRRILAEGEIAGAYKLGDTWIIPRQAAERWIEQRRGA